MTDGLRGACEQCEHVRSGSSVTQLALTALPDHDRPTVHPSSAPAPAPARAPAPAPAPAQSTTADDEAAARDFVVERENNRRHGKTMYSARPVGADFSYCGIYELSNIYACCETKNLDQSCAQFSPARDDETPHDCGTCRHQERVSPRVDVVLHQFLQSRSAGRTLLETTIEPSRAVAALSEFDACIDSAGFVHSRPAFLPHCAAMSTTDKPEGENRYLVGPVVNSAGRCAMWTPRTEPEFAAVDARLEALAERPARLHALGVELGMRRERLNALARQNSATAGYAVADEVRDAADRAALDDAHAGRLIAAETNAQADLIAFCLQQRGGSSELVASVTATWVPEGWVPDASFDDTYDLLDDVVLPAGGAVAPTTSPPDPPPSAPHPSAPPPSAPPASAPAPLAPAAAVSAAAVSAAAVSAAAVSAAAVSAAAVDAEGPAPIAPVTVPPVPFAVTPLVSYRHPADVGIGFLVVADAVQILLVYATGGSQVAIDLRSFPFASWSQLLTPTGPQPVSFFVQLPDVVNAVWLDPHPLD